ncbi:P1 family peptidase [Nakamurella leprariae]|uniref:P1 family peptidase n=1 Tax=Nakamurella leprariae TaxID=2803911 RepID=A0A938YE29_9ACTN|nr:P1 family peptidase [Nakamurella leprariae]MBM9466160.1 P1 family peptidase [Nakamurella leprariae]
MSETSTGAERQVADRASRPGPTNSLADVAGIRVGHATLVGDGHLTGTTVVLAPPPADPADPRPVGGMVAGVDVRGGAPGTVETDLLDPSALVEQVQAITLTGGSAYGLAAAAGVVGALAERGCGLSVGTAPDEVVPIAPGAVLFDLGRGGRFTARPVAAAGAEAVAAALRDTDPVLGAVGAGTGAVAGGLKGGVGQASTVVELPDGPVTVAALVVVNAAGSLVASETGALWGAPLLQPGDVPGLVGPPSTADRDRLLRLASGAMEPTDDPADPDPVHPAGADLGHSARPLPRVGPQDRGPGIPAGPDPNAPRHTTLAVLVTDAALTKAQCHRLATLGHDGMARAVNPVHTLFDGDVVFAAATGTRTLSGRARALPGSRAGDPAETHPADPMSWHRLLTAAGDTVTRATVRGVTETEGVTTAAGRWWSYRQAAPSAFRAD